MRRELSSRLFQSTRPIRGATPDVAVDGIGAVISIHAPHTGRDDLDELIRQLSRIFQSTRPIRGATAGSLHMYSRDYISIHAPHTGRDQYTEAICTKVSYFNPRAPYGARRYATRSGNQPPTFQSTRPIRGATGLPHLHHGEPRISIHAPHTGRDFPVA